MSSQVTADGTSAILEQLNAMKIKIDQLEYQIQKNHEESTKALAALTTYVDEGLMRLQNGAAGLTGLLRGPKNEYLPPPLITRDHLRLISDGPELDDLNAYLGGVPGYSPNASVPARREVLATYLGVVR